MADTGSGRSIATGRTGCDAAAIHRGGGSMRIRNLAPAVLVGTALVVAACGTGGTATGPTPTPDPCAGAAKHSGDARALPTDTSQVKIGVATDVGKVDDKNF